MSNICELIQCPFANLHPVPPRSSGCERYSVSGHCHLLRLHPQLTSNQYWLYADEGVVSIEEIKGANNNYISCDESSQFRLARMRDEA